jgi:3-hydroxyacyl-CoA dehydrogenase
VTDVRRLGVVGAGTMGAGIAAHAASAGLEVVLLDVVPDGARAALGRLAKARPAAFMTPADARRVTPGSMDEIGLLEGCDWVIEAVIEDRAVKDDVAARVRAAAPDAVLTSTTSTIPLASSSATASRTSSIRPATCACSRWSATNGGWPA